MSGRISLSGALRAVRAWMIGVPQRCNRFIGIVAISLLLSACENLSFYEQALRGQWQLILQRQPIEEVQLRTGVDDPLKAKLALIEEMRIFAARDLHLPLGDAYSTYVDLGRPYVVWNVFAAPEFSLEPKTWCFPIAGCIAYRGYFQQQGADQAARTLEAQGMDVFVGGVAAYSTLGWFDDSVLSTFVQRNEAGLAALLFHELAHRQLYLPGDTTFNESFARTVEIEGVKRWFEAKGDGLAFQAYLQGEADFQTLVGLLKESRDRLQVLYANTTLDIAERRRQKAKVFEDLRQQFTRLNADQRYQRYQAWMDRPFNNARLVTVATYNDWVPAFTALLAEHRGNLPAFFQAAKALSELDSQQRRVRLQDLSLRSALAQPTIH